MIKELLKAAGIFGCESRCPDPPAETYAIFFDEVTADGQTASTGFIRITEQLNYTNLCVMMTRRLNLKQYSTTQAFAGINSLGTGCKACNGIK